MRLRILALACLAAVAVVAATGCGGDDSQTAEAAFDRAFIDGMVPHHEQAIEMAKAAKAAGLSEPELVELADDVVATQRDEIERMRDWREEWFGTGEVDPAGAAELGLSESELGMEHDVAALEAAEDVDAEFARMMIDHHESAITMAKLALDQAEHDELRQLAEEIVAAQQREISVLQAHAAGQHSGH